MAFPVVESLTQTSGDASGGTSLSITLPGTINSGDLLLMLIAAETLVAPSWSTPAGWNALQTGQINGSDGAAIFWKSASGSETSPVSVSIGAATDGYAGQVFRISGWEGSGSGIAAATAVENASNSLDPPASPSMTAGGGDNLFIAVALMADDNDTITGASTSYTDLVNTVSANASINQGATVATWRRELAAATDDPGSVSISGGEAFRTTTIVIAESAAPPPSGAVGADTSSFAMLGATTGGGLSGNVAGFYALVATVGPGAKAAQTSKTNALAATTGDQGIPRTSQMVALVAYGTGSPERNSQRAWFFNLDGHTHYVLDLGTTKTLVYDLLTDQWAEWQTEGFPVWNAQLGAEWLDRFVVADIQSPAFYTIDPAQHLDEGFRPVRRKVTGIIPSPSRNYTSMDALYVMASVGDAQTDFAGTAEMTLRFSDDQGQSFYDFATFTLSSTDDDEELLFRSLGSFNMPGRIIEIEDLGGPVRIDSAQVVLR